MHICIDVKKYEMVQPRLFWLEGATTYGYTARNMLKITIKTEIGFSSHQSKKTSLEIIKMCYDACIATLVIAVHHVGKTTYNQ